jgi:YbbR domain-containing protein
LIERFRNNAGLKVLAFAIAAALWILVSGEQEAVQVYSVPVDFALSRDRMLGGEVPGTVQVRLRGSESILRGVAADDLRVPIDLSKAPPGQKLLRLLAAGNVMGVPSGAAVESISPDHLTLSVERKITRIVRVSPRLEGVPAAGFRMLEFDADPERVTIEGPESEVSRIAQVSTESIPLHGKDAGFNVSVAASIESPRIRVLENGPIKVTVRIEKDGTRK